MFFYMWIDECVYYRHKLVDRETREKRKSTNAVNTETTGNENSYMWYMCAKLFVSAFMLQLQKQLAPHCWKQSAAAVPQQNFAV